MGKVSTSLSQFPIAAERELKIYERLVQFESTHPGQSLIRELYDAFALQGTAGKHRCLVLQPMHMTVLEMMRLNPSPFKHVPSQDDAETNPTGSGLPAR